MSALSVLLIIIWSFIVLPIVGMLLVKGFDKDDFSIAECYAFGFVIMCIVFEVLATPMIFLSVPFHVLKNTFIAVMIILAALSLVRSKDTIKQIKAKGCLVAKICKSDTLTKVTCIFAALVILFQIALLVVFRHIDTDDARFIAEAVEAVERDTMLKYHPITGRFFDYPIGETFKEVASPYPLCIALLSSLFRLQPAVCAHSVMPALLIMLSYTVFYLIGRFFFEDNIKSIGRYMLILALIICFSFESIYTYGYTLLGIIWQGRSVMCMILIPMLLYVFMKVTRLETIELKHYLLLAGLMLANIMTSGMGIVLTAMICFAYALVNGFIRKSFPVFIKIFSCLSVNVIMLVIMKWAQAHCWK